LRGPARRDLGTAADLGEGGLREQGAGKAEAHELALAALAEVGGGAELATSRAAQRGARGDREIESWWVPGEAVHF